MTMVRWDAFISYSSTDAIAASRLQRALERYRLPGGRRLRVYRDETDIAGGELPAQLRRALGEAGSLIVCCSVAATQSRWVALEIEAFRELAPDRLLLPVLVADAPPDNLPQALQGGAQRWVDLRSGWRLGMPTARSRVELVRAIAAVAGIEFRELLPLDRRRRRRAMVRLVSATAVALLAAASWPVEHWTDVTPEHVAAFHCDTLADGVAFFRMNEPQAIKNIVTVQRSVFGPESSRWAGLDEVVPTGRLLPARVSRAVDSNCGRTGDGWVGEPEPGTCVRVGRTREEYFVADPMGGFDAPRTEVVVGDGEPVMLDVIWTPIDMKVWSRYGRTLTPSSGLPVSAAGRQIWLGFPDSTILRGHLWQSADGGKSWKVVNGASDIRSIRRMALGLFVAGRVDRKLGFWLQRDQGSFVPLQVPGKGDDIEVCGEVDGQPVIRVDRSAFKRERVPWLFAMLR